MTIDTFAEAVAAAEKDVGPLVTHSATPEEWLVASDALEDRLGPNGHSEAFRRVSASLREGTRLTFCVLMAIQATGVMQRLWWPADPAYLPEGPPSRWVAHPSEAQPHHGWGSYGDYRTTAEEKLAESSIPASGLENVDAELHLPFFERLSRG